MLDYSSYVLHNTIITKTLALLTSTLSWQKSIADTISKELEQDSTDASHFPEQETDGAEAEDRPQKRIPKVFYCTRTHSQLQQIVDELQKCSEDYKEHLSLCLLAARRHYCVNDSIRQKAEEGKESLDQLCRDAMEVRSCRFNRTDYGTQMVAERLNADKIWDIEDALELGRKHHGCPYFATKEITKTANYILARK
jgi:Rad3-related DNA helicase